MPKIYFSRVMAGAVLSAVLTVGSLSLAATPASASAGGGPPKWNGGPPPVAAPASCPTPDCVRGVPPAAAAPWPGARPAINCPPSIVARTTGGDGPGC